MTIYLLTWDDSDADYTAQRFAAATEKIIKQKYKEVLADKKNNLNITLLEPEFAIEKIRIKRQRDIINLINNL
jgi:hypothetical protein